MNPSSPSSQTTGDPSLSGGSTDTFGATIESTIESSLRLKYVSDAIISYIDVIHMFQDDSESFVKKLFSITGLYIFIFIIIGIFLVTCGIKFKWISLRIIFTFIMYSILKSFRKYLDPIAGGICQAVYYSETIKNLKIFGDEKDKVLGYLILSIVAISLLGIVVFWVKIISSLFLLYIVYTAYCEYVVTTGEETTMVTFGIVICITIIIIFIFWWIENIILSLIISFLGCSIILAFTSGFLDFPSEYDKFYQGIFQWDSISDTFKNVDFYFLLIPTIIVAMVQKRLYCQ